MSCPKTIMIMAESLNSKSISRVRRAEIRARFKADIERARQKLSKDLGIPTSVLRDICENATDAYGDHVEDDEIILRPWNTKEHEEDRPTSMTPSFATSSNSSTISSSSSRPSNRSKHSLAGPSNVTPQLSTSLPQDLQITPPRGRVRPIDTDSPSQRRSKRIRLRSLHLRETTPALRPMVVVDIESPSPERGDSMTITSNPKPRSPFPLQIEREPTTQSPGERDYIFVNSSPVLESTKSDDDDEGPSPLQNTQLSGEKGYLSVTSSPILENTKFEEDDEVAELPSSPIFLPILPSTVESPRLLQFRSASAPLGKCSKTMLPDRPIDKTVEQFLRKFKCEHLANWFAFLKLHAAPNLGEAIKLVTEDDGRFLTMFREAAVQCAISDQEAEMVLQALRECRGIDWLIE